MLVCYKEQKLTAQLSAARVLGHGGLESARGRVGLKPGMTATSLSDSDRETRAGQTLCYHGIVRLKQKRDG